MFGRRKQISVNCVLILDMTVVAGRIDNEWCPTLNELSQLNSSDT